MENQFKIEVYLNFFSKLKAIILKLEKWKPEFSCDLLFAIYYPIL